MINVKPGVEVVTLTIDGVTYGMDEIAAMAVQHLENLKRRFFLFGWEDYETRGGADDFIGVFGSLEEAQNAERPHCDAGHIATFDGMAFHVVSIWGTRVSHPNGVYQERTGWFTPEEW